MRKANSNTARYSGLNMTENNLACTMTKYTQCTGQYPHRNQKVQLDWTLLFFFFIEAQSVYDVVSRSGTQHNVSVILDWMLMKMLFTYRVKETNKPF